MRTDCNSDVTVVIAALNEKRGIGPTLQELIDVLDNPFCLVVDGNSHDGTGEIAKELGAESLVQEGKGKGDALFKGIKQLNSDARYVVFIDADYTYPAEYVPGMVKVLEENHDVGMVIGNRFNGEYNFDKTITNPFYIGNRLLAFAQYVVNGIKLEDPLSGLRVIRSDVFENWEPKSKSFDIEVELNSIVNREGYRIVEVPIKYRTRLGKKKLGLRHGLGIMKRILAESLYT